MTSRTHPHTTLHLGLGALMALTTGACTTAAQVQAPQRDGWTTDGEVSRTDSPCESGETSTVAVDEDDNTWCGCGDEPGIYLLAQGESEFGLASGSEDSRVYELEISESGEVVVAGEDGSGEPLIGTLSLDASGNVQLASLLDLSIFASIDMDTATDASADANGNMFASDGSVLVTYDASADSWSGGEDWDEASLSGSGEAHTMLSITSDGDSFVASGSSASTNAAVFAESSADGATYHMAVLELDSHPGRLNATTHTSGEGYAAVGIDTAQSAGLLATCSAGCDEGDGWSTQMLTDFSSSAGEAHDVAFDSTGTFGVIAGASADAADEGYLLVTADGGASWSAVITDDPLPSMTACDVHDDGTFEAAGEADVFVSGVISAK